LIKPISILIPASQVKHDSNLAVGNCGVRKICVPAVYSDSEIPLDRDLWEVSVTGEKCPVQISSDYEISYFNQDAKQKRHAHSKATEIYECLEGQIRLEVEDKEYTLQAGDLLIIHPSVNHLVLPSDAAFLGRVILIRHT
jgi:mannose-6-phosphate isomerase-like protein (cupin superfamily)